MSVEKKMHFCRFMRAVVVYTVHYNDNCTLYTVYFTLCSSMPICRMYDLVINIVYFIQMCGFIYLFYSHRLKGVYFIGIACARVRLYCISHFGIRTILADAHNLKDIHKSYSHIDLMNHITCGFRCATIRLQLYKLK